MMNFVRHNLRLCNRIRLSSRNLTTTTRSGNDLSFYSLGVNVARHTSGELRNLLSKEEIYHVLAGFSDSMNNLTSKEEDMLEEQREAIEHVITTRAKKYLEIEKQRGIEFSASYLKHFPEAKQLPSGLIFHEVVTGNGEEIPFDATYVLQYHGTFIDGTVFDSSIDRHQPIQCNLTDLIPGWQEALKMMQIGSKATLVIPSDLAYGDSGNPQGIPAGATLLFDLELLDAKR